MKHSIITFGKDLYDLKFSDIENYFTTNREENLNLEFKSYTIKGEYSKKEEAIKKGVCALLNSEGGIIIWGAPIEIKDKDGNTSAQGALTPFETDLDRDRLINKLVGSMTPLPIGIRVQVLTNNENKAVIILEVEKSIERPHQYDNRYYVRLDGQTRIAPHYLISALMKSVDFPVLRGHLRLKRIEQNGSNILLYFRQLLFNTSLFNNDKNVHVRFLIPRGQILSSVANKDGTYSFSYPLLTHGAPLVSNFILSVPSSQIYQDIEIIFQFGGEKSPSKNSFYTYRMSGSISLGEVNDENIYLIEKIENKLPFETSNNSIEESIEGLLG